VLFIYVLITAVKTSSMTYDIKSLRIHAHMHAKHKSPSIPEHPAAVEVARARTVQREGEGWKLAV